MHRTRVLLGLGLTFSMIIAACSGAGTGSTAAPSVAAPSVAAPSAEAPSEAPSAAPSEDAVTGATVALAESSLGQILVDGEGRTLYGFTVDTEGVSACYDDCEQAWPPLLASGEVTAGAGIDASLITTVERTDGTKQVKYGDWPLYYFASDSAAGDTNGQGINDVWFVVDATGALIR
jgi:predicted lipoprotein with Yx(FWY)xxD motif